MRYSDIMVRLLSIYEKGEAESVLRIAAEDIFGVKAFKLSKEVGTEAEKARWEEVIARLLRKEPVQYITETAYFGSGLYKVNPSVLIPRFETEELLYWISSEYKKNPSPKRVLDVGTGSGCIAIELKKLFPNAEVLGVDISEDALAVARENAERFGVTVGFKQVNFLDESDWARIGWETRSIDLVVSNPPYIGVWETERMSENTIFEPKQALFVEGEDVLIFYKKLSTFAERFLHPTGSLWMELNEFYAVETKNWLENTGVWGELRLEKDMRGAYRCCCARSPRFT